MNVMDTFATNQTVVNTVRYGDTVATIGASTIAPTFNYDSHANHKIFIDDVDVTYVVQKQAESIKNEAIAYEESKSKPKPKDLVKSILINPVKGVTTVVWNDGTVTVVHCNNEEFDAEKGIAMCFMKKAFDNRGCFNDFLNKYLDDKNWTQKPKSVLELRSAGSYSFTLEDAKVNLKPFDITGAPNTENQNEVTESKDDEPSGFLELTEEDWKEIFGSKEDEDETE